MRVLLISFLMMLSLGQVSGQTTVPQLESITTENATSLEEVAVLGRGTANTLDWHPDGDVLAVGSSTGVWLLDENLELIGDTPIKQYVTKLAWSPDGSQIAVVSNARGRCTIQVWDADFTEATVQRDTCGGEALWNSTGQYVAVFDPPYSGGASNEVQLINPTTHETAFLPGQDGVWSPDGDVLFTRLRYSRTYSDTPTLYSWDVDTKEAIAELEIPEDYQWNDILWAVDDHTLTLLCNDFDEQTGYVSVNLCSLDVSSGKVSNLREIDTYSPGQRTPPNNFARNRDERYFASVVNRSTPGFFDYILVIGNLGSHLNAGEGFAFDWKPETDTLTAIVGNGEIRTYNARMREVLAQSQWFTAPINDIDSRPNSDEIASTGFGYEQDTYVWDMNEAFVEPILSFYIEDARTVDYTPDGSELIVDSQMDMENGFNQSINAYDPDTGVFLRNVDVLDDQGESPPRRYWNSTYTEFVEVDEDGTLTFSNSESVIETHSPIEYVFWSPDNSMLATMDRIPQDYSFFIRTWDIATAEQINTYASGMFAFDGLVWSSDGSQIAALIEHPTGSEIYVRGVRVFAVSQGQDYDFDGNDYQVFSEANVFVSLPSIKASWNSDGTLLAIVLVDEIQIHDINGDGEPLVTLPAYGIVDLVWSSDDRSIAGGSADGTIRVWGVPSSE